jgi:hypothetical protein
VKACAAAGLDAGELRAELIQRYVAAIRTLDPSDKDQGRTWCVAMRELDYRLNGKPVEVIESAPSLTEEEALAKVREFLDSLPTEKRLELFGETVQ